VALTERRGKRNFSPEETGTTKPWPREKRKKGDRVQRERFGASKSKGRKNFGRFLSDVKRKKEERRALPVCQGQRRKGQQPGARGSPERMKEGVITPKEINTAERGNIPLKVESLWERKTTVGAKKKKRSAMRHRAWNVSHRLVKGDF